MHLLGSTCIAASGGISCQPYSIGWRTRDEDCHCLDWYLLTCMAWTRTGKGCSGKIAEEIDTLRRLARKGEDRQRLGRLMEIVSDKTASAVAVAPPKSTKVRSPLLLHLHCMGLKLPQSTEVRAPLLLHASHRPRAAEAPSWVADALSRACACHLHMMQALQP